ncbi:hypothetical protein PEX1_025430 [Penicillium expansum]|uniref:Uncharacterized protein n=1 Tax=Penicillium expansum TaxID=27334 RepID=A0A0A2K9Y2_PENEN|nr:hypothetical protein PEX2_102240 [Penicillium expansum]KGO46040.1 hypothetical protein PEXP_016820 [Penicillium expansum]KGO61150.1 hypothetical protein PEX2_102240 [Penicillium expansum]KGO69050.1 hypothetical protein PEX1_025430 [Penicillium expansum]
MDGVVYEQSLEALLQWLHLGFVQFDPPPMASRLARERKEKGERKKKLKLLTTAFDLDRRSASPRERQAPPSPGERSPPRREEEESRAPQTPVNNNPGFPHTPAPLPPTGSRSRKLPGCYLPPAPSTRFPGLPTMARWTIFPRGRLDSTGPAPQYPPRPPPPWTRYVTQE